MLSMGRFDLVEELAELSEDGHMLAARAALSAGLGHHFRHIRERSILVLRRELAAVAEDRFDVAMECISGLTDKALLDEDSIVRVNTVDALGDIALGMSHMPQVQMQIAEALVSRAPGDQAHVVRKAIVEILSDKATHAVGEHGELVAFCVDALAPMSVIDRHEIVRHSAAVAIGKLAVASVHAHADVASECIAGLSKALFDTNFVVRDAASEGLGAVGA